MSGRHFLFINIVILPLIIIVGKFSHISIALFWVTSFILGLYYMRPVIKECGVLNLLSPCVLAYLYSSLNFVLGSLYYCTDFLTSTRLYVEFFSIENIHLLFILAFLNICNAIVAVLGNKYPIQYSTSFTQPKKPFRLMTFIILFALFVILHVFIFDLSMIGGSAKGSQIIKTGTEMNYPFILGIVILIAHKLNTYKTPIIWHIVIIGAIIGMLAVDSVGSKREVFFIILAILMIYLIHHDRKIRVSIKTTLIAILMVVVAGYYILSASIVRGYGGFGVEKLSEATKLVSEYMDTDNFQMYVGNNFEIPYHYASSVLSCDYTLTGKTPILFGETLIKVLFITIPKSIYKPRKMIDVFTTAYTDAHTRETGLSLPVSVYSELFANFHVVSLVFLYLIFLAFQKIYIKMINLGRQNNFLYIYLVAACALTLQFVRGSGLESLIIYTLMAAASIIIGKVMLSGFLPNENKFWQNHC